MLNAGGGSYIEKKKACGFTAHNAPTTITRGWSLVVRYAHHNAHKGWEAGCNNLATCVEVGLKASPGSIV